MPGLGGRPPFLHGLRPHAVLAHQPSDTMLAHAVALFDQGVPDTGTALGFPRLLEGSREWPNAAFVSGWIGHAQAVNH